MAIKKCSSHVDVYKELAESKDVSSLSGRNDIHMTEYVNSQILQNLTFNKSDVVCDIGCGDASLLKLIRPMVKQTYGLLPTPEEVNLVTENLANENNGIKILKSYSNDIRVDDSAIDKVICNGVMILLSKTDVIKTLIEIKRISKNGAICYLGEVPFINETKKVIYGDSILMWLLYTLYKNGVKSFYYSCKRVIKALFHKKESFLIKPKELFYIPEKEFIEILKSMGFDVVTVKYHNFCAENKDDELTRKNYIVRVIK